MTSSWRNPSICTYTAGYAFNLANYIDGNPTNGLNGTAVMEDNVAAILSFGMSSSSWYVDAIQFYIYWPENDDATVEELEIYAYSNIGDFCLYDYGEWDVSYNDTWRIQVLGTPAEITSLFQRFDSISDYDDNVLLKAFQIRTLTPAALTNIQWPADLENVPVNGGAATWTNAPSGSYSMFLQEYVYDEELEEWGWVNQHTISSGLPATKLTTCSLDYVADYGKTCDVRLAISNVEGWWYSDPVTITFESLVTFLPAWANGCNNIIGGS